MKSLLSSPRSSGGKILSTNLDRHRCCRQGKIRLILLKNVRLFVLLAPL
ncbi:MAG: hypothetical protein LBR79_01835 [Oscillospiraceae bacterium]|nr:hypothetical protein [Oscillospiraceae bacterium]